MKLEDKIKSHFRLGPATEKALEKLNLETIRDLLFYFPNRYSEISQIRNIETLEEGELVTILGKISGLSTQKGFRSKIPMSKAILSDLTGSINIVWFHQPYLAKMIKNGGTVRVTGRVSNSKTYGLTLTNPEIKNEGFLPIDINDSLFSKDQNNLQYGYPIYHETKGITSKWIYHAINKIFKQDYFKEIEDYLPKEILDKYKLPSLKTALVWIHNPKKKEHWEIARKRFAFEEVFFIQLSRQQERKKSEKLFSYKLEIDRNDIEDFMSRFPFKPTNSQTKTIKTILEDLKKDKPMSRLIEGDVGSGKTFIAATISYAVIKNRPLRSKSQKSSKRDKPAKKGERLDFGNLQVAYMAPTEVLAIQLFENFIKYFEHTGISIGLVTSSGCRKFPAKTAGWKDGKQIKTWTTISKNQLLKWVKNGEIPIVIGTHSLISKSVLFEDLGLVIIDEQHRFGTNQRMKLAKKEGQAPHYLSMTATPIPRTLALTVYGDLDLSIIDEMPSGRKKVITEIVPENKREDAYKKIEEELEKGKQMYVICPKIDEPDEGQQIKLDVKSVTSEAKRLKEKVFPNKNIDIMHSKMSKQKKEEVMKKFEEKKIDILVSTSVIEVGVNIPNATVIIIEGAERFGLAQLHQLRGRVIRGEDQAYCYLFAKAKTEKTISRLEALKTAKNGFELAELDLNLRGAGLLTGDKQWGITDLGMEAIKNIKMVEAAREEAIKIIGEDQDLESFPKLEKIFKSKKLNLHFE